MIVRNVAVRQGRTVLAAPLAAGRTSLRSLSTDTTTTPIDPMGTTLATGNMAHVSVPPLGVAPTVAPAAPAAGGGGGGRRTPVPRVADPRLQARFGVVKTEVLDTTARDFYARQKLWRMSRGIGGTVSDRRYAPGAVLKDPPRPKDVTLEMLMAAQCHMGHHASLWNPACARYIYGVRQGIHIISLEQTAAYLRRAARLVEEVAFRGGLILYVGTRAGQMEAVVGAARRAGGCHLFSKWTPGTITNRDQMLAGALVKIVDEHDKEVPGFEKHMMDRRPLMPDLVVCLNPIDNYVLLHECVVANIPTVGVIDTNGDPSKVTYPIPANDDSLRATALIAGVLGRAGELGQKRRKAAAKRGEVTWENPLEITRFLERQAEEAAEEVREKLGRSGRPGREKKLMDSEDVDELKALEGALV